MNSDFSYTFLNVQLTRRTISKKKLFGNENGRGQNIKNVNPAFSALSSLLYLYRGYDNFSYQNFCQICCTKNYKPFVAAPTTEMYCCQLQVRPSIDNLYGFFQFFLIRSQNINQYG